MTPEGLVSVVRKIPRTKIRRIIASPEESAKIARLSYVKNGEAGISRLRSGKSFRYVFKNKTVRDRGTISRIRSLAIPPAWEQVWICSRENGHLQATGIDAKGRKQYRYHPLWTQLRNETKFYRMIDFGKALPGIRKQVRKDLALAGMAKEKILAAIVAIMERTSIRIGNEEYEKANGSIGLTTMKNRHVQVKGSSLRFSFTGKTGKEHLISLQSKKLARIIRQCREIPGRDLFQYYDDENNRQSIDSGMVNDYIRSISGSDFSAKDFRTWAGTVKCLVALKACGPANSNSEAKKKFVEVLDQVAKHLGNTRSVCKKFYVHPCLGELYESQQLQRYLDSFQLSDTKPQLALAPEERTVLRILRYGSHNGSHKATKKTQRHKEP